MLKKLTMVLLILTLSTAFSWAQLVVKGKITDKRGAGLAGANLSVLNTSYGTTANLDGEYSIELPSSAAKIILEAQYVGYKSQQKTLTQLDGTAEVNFELGYDILEMEAVVVTGTADPTQKKKLGNSIGMVAGSAVDNGSAQIDAALSGKVAGAMVQMNSGTPGGGTSVRLRGTSSISRSAEPLYIIDGIVVDNSSSELVDLGGYRSNRIADLDPNDIDHIEVIKGAAAAALYGSRANDGVVQIFTKRGKAGSLKVDFRQNIGFDTPGGKLKVSSYPYRGGATVVDPETGWTYYDQNALVPVKRYDWHDDIYRTGWTNSTAFSMSGGDEKTQYYLSGSRLNQDGVMRGTDYRKQSVRLNLNQYVNEWLSVSATSNYIHSNANLVPNGGLVGFYGVYTNLIFGPNIIDYRPDPETGVYPDATNYGIFTANPLDVIHNWSAPQEIDRFIGGVKFALTPMKDLSMNLNVGYDTYTQTAKEFTPKNSSAPGRADGYSKSAVKTSKLLNIDADASYTIDVTSDIQSISTAGVNYQSSYADIVSSTATNLTMLVELVQGETQFSGEYVDTRKTLGYYFQETAGWKDKLYVTGSLRMDASSTFGSDVRWQMFPKFSTSYSYNDNMKFRAAYGFSGGQPVDSYSQYSNYLFQEYSGGAGVVNALRGGNPDLKPERMEEFEIGTDLSFLDNRIGVELTYYNSKVHDLILPKNVARSTGYTEQLANVGVLSNKGIEIMLRTINYTSEDFLWTSSFTFSKNTPLIETLSDGGAFALPGSWGIVWVDEGEVPGYFWGYTQGGQLDLDGDGTMDGHYEIDPRTGLPVKSPEKAIIGNPNPDFVWSFINDFKIFSNFSVNIQFDAMIGQDVFNFTERMLQTPYFASGTEYDKEIKGEVPVGYYNTARKTYENYIEDGSFVKLRNLALKYRLHQPFVDALGVEGIEFSLVGRNLLTFTKYTGMDPEVNVAAQSTMVRGFDFATVPIPKSWNFGIQVKF